MSGTAFSFRTPPCTSSDLLEMISSTLGCGTETDVVLCLKQQSAEKFQLEFSSALMANLPSSGDDLVPEPIQKLVNNQAYLDEVGFFNRSYIVSITKHDGYIRVNSLFGHIDTTSLESSILDMSRLLQLPEYVTKSLILEYLKLYDELEQAVISINTDFFYLKRSNHFLEAYSTNSLQGRISQRNNAYFMSFDPIPKYFPHQYAVHAVDLLYLFDLSPKFLEDVYFTELEGDMSDEDLKLRVDFCDLITAFMKTGNPNEYLKPVKNIEWPAYENINKPYLSFSLQSSVYHDLFGARRDIWKVLVGQWKKEYEYLQMRHDL